MIYTKDQLVKMSDHEINLAVAEKMFGIDNAGVGEHVYVTIGCGFTDIFEPCSSWNKVMPIAKKFRISLMFYNNDENFASHESIGGDVFDDSFVMNKNIKRAICEVFLMMDIESASS